MAEWFKAADLRPAIIDAWVRTPLAAFTPTGNQVLQKSEGFPARTPLLLHL